MKDKFEYTETGFTTAKEYLQSIGELYVVTDDYGIIDNMNAVAYANVLYNKLHPVPIKTMTMNEILGIKDDDKEIDTNQQDDDGRDRGKR